MSYRRFEELVIALGVGAVSAALLLSLGGVGGEASLPRLSRRSSTSPTACPC
jgi:hypothetical protein